MEIEKLYILCKRGPRRDSLLVFHSWNFRVNKSVHWKKKKKGQLASVQGEPQCLNWLIWNKTRKRTGTTGSFHHSLHFFFLSPKTVWKIAGKISESTTQTEPAEREREVCDLVVFVFILWVEKKNTLHRCRGVQVFWQSGQTLNF